MIAKLGGSATFDWTGLVSTAAQITGAGGLIGFGVVLAWLFAREFADGTITGLFALPIGRGTIAAAKLAIYTVWAVSVSLLIAAALLLLGLVLGFGMPDASAWAGLGRQLGLGILTAAIALPGRLGRDSHSLPARGGELRDRARHRGPGRRDHWRGRLDAVRRLPRCGRSLVGPRSRVRNSRFPLILAAVVGAGTV